MSDLVGLNELANDPNLTFIAFIAYFLLAVLGLRFGLFAYWNGRASNDDAQIALWGYLLLIGLSAGMFGLLGVGRIVLFLDWLLELASGVALLLVLMLALGMREIAATTAARGDGESARSRRDSLLTWVFVLTVLGVTVALVALPDQRDMLAGPVGVSGLAFLVYGYKFGSEQLGRSRVQGTLLDTLLRHLLPVLLFAAFIPITELAIVAGLDRIIVLHVQIVFVIMTATTLMTSTIKLRQNLMGMRT